MFGKKKAPPAKAAPAAAKPAGDAKAGAKAPAKKGGLKLPFGKKKVEAPAPAKTAVAPAPKPAGDAKPAAKAPAKAKGGGPLKLLLPLLVVAALGVGIFFVYTRFIAPGSKPAAETQTLASLPTAQADDADSLANASKANARKTRQAEAASAGDANAENSGDAPANAVGANCVTAPAFLGKLGLGSNASFEVSDTHRLVLLVPVSDSDAVSKYQNQSWSQAGLVGAFALDRKGNVYVAPSPRLGPGVKAAKPQNVIYKVDTNTGNLAPYVTLPDTSAPTPENPFGIVGLAYDCDTNSLYVSTLAGSTADKEAGHVYRVDLGLSTVAGRLDNVDALGLAVGISAKGKTLYFGSARTPQLRAVNLEASGDFQGSPRDVGALADAQRALRLTLSSPAEMIVQAVEFNPANADTPQGSEIRYRYETSSDQWTAGQ